MITRIMGDLARSLFNLILVVSVVGFLLAGGTAIKIWKNRP